jgi:hypothetical protein
MFWLVFLKVIAFLASQFFQRIIRAIDGVTTNADGAICRPVFWKKNENNILEFQKISENKSRCSTQNTLYFGPQKNGKI